MADNIIFINMVFGLLLLTAAVFLVAMTIGFIMDKKVLKIISFVAIIVFNLTVISVLWINK